MPNVDRSNDIVTVYEGKDGYALVDKAGYESMLKEIERLNRIVAKYQCQADVIESRRGSSQACSWIDFL